MNGNDTEGRHMVAEATLLAHFVAAARKAGMSRDDINGVLRRIADRTVISEFWISDERGRIAYASHPEIAFSAFPTDPNADTQAAPFAALLTGEKTVLVQDAQPRVADGARYRYAGVAGVDQPRIVQVGLAADAE